MSTPKGTWIVCLYVHVAQKPTVMKWNQRNIYSSVACKSVPLVCQGFLLNFHIWELAFGSVLNKQCISMWEQWRGTVASGKALKITSYLYNWDFSKDQWDFLGLRPKEIVPLEAVNSCSSVISKENHSYPRSRC